MVNLLIDEIKKENQRLHISLQKMNDHNFVYETVCKILNDLDLSEDEIDRFLTIINQEQLIKGSDKETLDFILLILLPNGIKLEKSQKDMLNKLLNLYPKQMNNNILETISRNEMLIINLESKELFIYFDELKSILDQFNYNYKDRLIIIKELIQRNYYVQLENPKEKTTSDNSEINTECLAPVPYEETEQVNNDMIEVSDNQSFSDVTEKKVEKNVVLDKEIIDFFRKYKLYYGRLDDNLKIKLNKCGSNIKKADYVMTLLKKLKIDYKSFYNHDCESFVDLILYSELEYINEIIDTTNKRYISLIDLICRDYKVLYSKQFDGHFERFMANIDFLDSLHYDYKENKDVTLYCVNNDNLKASYDLYTNIYKLKLGNIQNISILAICEWQAVMDQFIEISRNAIYSVEQTDMQIFEIYDQTLCYILKSFDYQTRMEYSLSQLAFLVTSGSDPKDVKDRIDSRKDEMDSYKVEKTDYECELDQYFLHATDRLGSELWIMPHTVKIEPTILENEYVNYLESNYRIQAFAYLINKTRVSRIKVLRVLSYLFNQGIEITKDVVKYALKFNYIFTKGDLENIDSVFNQKKKIWK